MTTTLDWSQCPAVESIPGKVSGAWVFKDTRMPVATVFENLQAGLTVEEVMEEFSVTGADQRGTAFRGKEPINACSIVGLADLVRFILGDTAVPYNQDWRNLCRIPAESEDCY